MMIAFVTNESACDNNC